MTGRFISAVNVFEWANPVPPLSSGMMSLSFICLPEIGSSMSFFRNFSTHSRVTTLPLADREFWSFSILNSWKSERRPPTTGTRYLRGLQNGTRYRVRQHIVGDRALVSILSMSQKKPVSSRRSERLNVWSSPSWNANSSHCLPGRLA